MKRSTLVILLGLAAVWLRFSGLRWGYGLVTHPDEARIAMAIGELLKNAGNPKFFAYGHFPLYLQAGLFKLRQWTGFLTPNFFFEMVVSGRMVAAVLSLGTVFLTGRIAFLLGASFFSSWLAAFLMAFFPLAVQLSQFSTVDAHLTFFAALALERAIVLGRNRRWRDFAFLSLTLGAALACKASALPLLAAVLLGLLPHARSPKFWLLPLAGVAAFFLFQPYAALDAPTFFREVAEQARWVRGQGPPVFFHQYEDSLKFIFSTRDLFFFSVGPLAFLLSFLGAWRLRRNREAWGVLAWFAINGFLLGTSFAKFSRYWLPVLPAFAVLAAFGAEYLRERCSPRLLKIAAAVLVAHTVASGLAVHWVHLKPHPAAAASRFVASTIGTRPVARILYDSVWTGFPAIANPVGGRPLATAFAGLFEPGGDPFFVRQVAGRLSEADFFVTINHLSLRTAYEQLGGMYPKAQVFEALLHDRLGYRLQGVFSSPLWFSPGGVPDFFLDYSIPIYDRPTILVWENRGRKTAADITREILDTPVLSPRASLRAYECLSESGILCASVPGLSESQPAKKFLAPAAGTPDPGILAPRIFQPFVWYLFFIFLGLAFWPLAARIFPGSLAGGYALSKILGLAVLGYVHWILGHFPGDLAGPWIARGLCLAGLAFGIFLWKRGSPVVSPLDPRTMHPALLVEALSLAAFAAFFTFRLFAPDIFWSENPIDLGYFSILQKAVSMPPPDPGYAGTFLNYYYYGFLLFSFPAKVLGIPPNVAYGLAMATVPSLIAGVVLTLGSSIDSERPRIRAGLLSVALVLLAGNWDGIDQLVRFLRDSTQQFWAFDFFRSAHAVIVNTVHEFPLWSWLFVDLHAHVLSGVLFVAFLAWLRFCDLLRPSIPQLAVGALLLGSMGPTNTWDYFTASVLVIALGLWLSVRRRSSAAIRAPLFLLVLSYVLFSPFYLIFTKKLAQLGIGWVGPLMTVPYAAVICMGLFLTVIYLAQPVWLPQLKRLQAVKSAWISATAVLVLACILTAVFRRFPFTLLLYALPAIAAGCLALREETEFPHLRSRFLVAFGLVVLGFCEIFFIKDWLQGGEWKRMNTVFKFYYQVWFMFALAAPAVFREILRATTSRRMRIALTGTWGLALAAAFFWPVGGVRARTVQHAFAFSGRSEVTFDGLSWLKHGRPHEYAVIAWLWKNGTAADVLMEASHLDYQYEFNVVSAASGVPSVLTWWSHADQRDRPFDPRMRLVKEFYETPDARTALRILRRFRVTYVYVGEREREKYNNTGLAKFTERPDIFESVLTFPQAVLYRVRSWAPAE